MRECREIYAARPSGCRFYPVFFEPSSGRCVVDKDRPRPAEALQDVDMGRTCRKIKRFLREELGLA
ncbi:MAG: hypothetical protein Kow0069_29760 [Promethearchaeota archaeon]